MSNIPKFVEYLKACHAVGGWELVARKIDDVLAELNTRLAVRRTYR